MATRSKSRNLNFRLHPRVFEALGADLVTSDFVAITELVKNSYDAFARRVDVRFGRDAVHGDYIEVLDDGQGMDAEVLESVWCVVATPYRAESPIARRGSKTRRAVGEKGLGRLSAARLGASLELLTKSRSSPHLLVNVSWASLSKAADISECHVTLTEVDGKPPFTGTGTRLRVYGIYATWDDERITELEEHLSRLISPFRGGDDFAIWLRRRGRSDQPVRVVSPAFLHKPKYKIAGRVDEQGSIAARYSFTPTKGEKRSSALTYPWTEVVAQVRDPFRARSLAAAASPGCGSFEFEIRAWDIDQKGVEELSERFSIGKRTIRSIIKAHKGISVYRDAVLVLPKSETTRDWLGLDLRRVSDVGTRLSTSQIIGYVAITAEANPSLKDTSDRERLVDSIEVAAFEEAIKAIVSALERERQKDRLNEKTAHRRMASLFEGLSAESLSEKVAAIAEQEGSAADVLPLIEKFNLELEQDRTEIERRFTYYSRLATVGTLAQMLVHEVRNKTTILSAALSALEAIRNTLGPQIVPKLDRARNAVDGLDRLAETFSPLASRSFGRGKRVSLIEERIRDALALFERAARDGKITLELEATGTTKVRVDPGELDALIINLIDNAMYWLSRESSRTRRLRIEVQRGRGRASNRVKVQVHDSGTGVGDEEAERIFWPGVTSKPGGIGMGLTIASEIVEAYEGKLALVQPGELGGATFTFDLPVREP